MITHYITFLIDNDVYRNSQMKKIKTNYIVFLILIIMQILKAKYIHVFLFVKIHTKECKLDVAYEGGGAQRIV